MKQIEKHSSGVTYGLGENGKLWVLVNEKNSLKESYKGPYVHTDEIEVHTYENQRWNAVTSLLGLRNGFTLELRFPTDRPSYSDETGKIRRRKDECILPSNLFSWSSGWQVDFSLLPGVDRDGWQYAFDFRDSYHPVRNPLKDFVRRRRWTRKCRIKTFGLWQPPSSQIHRLTSISIDQEQHSTNIESDKFIL